MDRRRPTLLSRFRPDLSFILLVGFMAIIWIAGGASRADVIGQAVTRASAWIVLVIAILCGRRPSFSGVRPILYLLLAMIVLPLVQLIPLPPSLWEHLPERHRFSEIASILGEAQPWRPWSTVPGNTLNALFSLVVPLTVLVLTMSAPEAQRRWTPALFLGLIAASTLLGLVQFSGSGFDNPFVNDSPWYVGGVFANRNHYALWLAIGCMIAPTWVFQDRHSRRWRAPVALGLVLVFSLTILATGSRAGLLIGAIALGFALLLSWSGLKRMLRHAPHWVFPTMLAGIISTVVALIALSITADRAVSVQRVFALNAGQDLRARALPYVWSMIRDYFPAGSGMGSFEPIFRMREPFGLLKPTYFNHAHNDLLELLSDGGLIAGIIMVAAVGWWFLATVRAWRGGPDAGLARLGSSTILLVMIASLFDYPARVPTIMATIMIAAIWLSTAEKPLSRPTLPTDDQQL